MKEQPGRTVRNALAATFIFVLLAAIVFVASSGPLLALAMRSSGKSYFPAGAVIRVYSPVVRACPRLMVPYLTCFGFQELEVFFIFLQQSQQSLPEIKKVPTECPEALDTPQTP